MKHSHPYLLPVVLCVSFFSGCGASSDGPQQSFTQADSAPLQATANQTGFAETAEMMVAATTTQQPDVEPLEVVPQASPESVTRKIIYNTSISVRVESFDGIAARVVRLTEQCGGFIASASLSGSPGDQRSGSWTIRLPVEQYRTFLDSTGQFGETLSKHEHTRAVTAEFYDIEARVRNKQIEEKRLITLLEERLGKLDDVLTFEKEISRVRGEIEQLQGRLRVLANLTAFSTVTLQISEVLTYAPTESPTFSTLIARQWQSTVGDLTAAGQWIVLSVISVGPWLLILVMVAYLVSLAVRFGLWIKTKQPAV